jgi:predicted alpha/beta-fold hydrolase
MVSLTILIITGRRLQSGRFLYYVAVPTLALIVNSEDDPLFCPSVFPTEKSGKGGGNVPLKMVRTKHGGHLGYIFHEPDQEATERAAYWMPTELARFVEHIHSHPESLFILIITGRRLQSGRFLCYVAVPTLALIVNSEDDPLFCPSVFPTEKSGKGGGNVPLKMVRTKHGGHLGYIFHEPDQEATERAAYWMPTELARFVEHIHSHPESHPSTDSRVQ